MVKKKKTGIGIVAGIVVIVAILFALSSAPASVNFQGSKWTEFDLKDKLSIDSSSISFTDLSNKEDSKMRGDYESGFFGNNIIHQFEFIINAEDKAELDIWALTNEINGLAKSGNEPVISWITGGTPKGFNIHDYDYNVDQILPASNNVKYFVTIERNGRDFSITAREGSYTGTSIGTKTVKLLDDAQYQYLFLTSTRDSQISRYASTGSLSNLILAK